MATVIVVGGGFAGLATAARLAKQKHDVTVLERAASLGGRLLPRAQDGFSWDRGPTTITMPAVVRDLFRKSGRPLERVLELEPVTPGRRHVFDRQTWLDLPFGSRGDQVDAIDRALGNGGEAWAGYVDSLSPVWEVLRQRAVEVPFVGREVFDHGQWRTLDVRRTLAKRIDKWFKDERLRRMAVSRFVLEGQDPRAMPALLGVADYLERSFGRWRPVGGMLALAAALTARMDDRGIAVRTSSAVDDVTVNAGAVTGVLLADGEALAGDVVVWTAPRLPPVLTTESRMTPAIPAAMTYVGLRGPVPDLPAETLVHNEPLVRVRTGGIAPPGCHAWSLEHRSTSEDVLVALARQGVDVRRHVVSRIDVSPTETVQESGGSPAGMRWQGWRSGLQRPRAATDVRGLFRAGNDVHPGPGLAAKGLGAAAVAALVGPA
ncbi:MAG: phytoene desaturase family protein [Nocardioidaceae bacterium]